MLETRSSSKPTDLYDAERFIRIVLIQVIDVARKGERQQMVFLPQAAQLLIQNIWSHVEGIH